MCSAFGTALGLRNHYLHLLVQFASLHDQHVADSPSWPQYSCDRTCCEKATPGYLSQIPPINVRPNETSGASRDTPGEPFIRPTS